MADDGPSHSLEVVELPLLFAAILLLLDSSSVLGEEAFFHHLFEGLAHGPGDIVAFAVVQLVPEQVPRLTDWGDGQGGQWTAGVTTKRGGNAE